VNQGHSVIIIEHNLDVIKSADWLIDIGPEGGFGGGQIVGEGTPEEISEMEESHTGRFLKDVLWYLMCYKLRQFKRIPQLKVNT